MNIKYKELVKDQLVYLLLPAVSAAIFAGALVYSGMGLGASFSDYSKQTKELKQQIKTKEDLQQRIVNQKVQERDLSAGLNLKQIIELEGMKFGVEASFAPMFDNVISIAKDSGVRIRSAGYNYSPSDDPIFASKIAGYNVCELAATIVGKYSEIQAFLKTLLSEKYLINLAEIEIVPWRRDKSILIAGLKIRFYTKIK